MLAHTITGSKRVTLFPPVALLSQPIEFLLLGIPDAPASLVCRQPSPPDLPCHLCLFPVKLVALTLTAAAADCSVAGAAAWELSCQGLV